MRRSVLIDDNLLEEARRVLGTKGIWDTVALALRETIRRAHREELRRSLGKVELDLIPAELARLRDEG